MKANKMKAKLCYPKTINPMIVWWMLKI